MPVEKKNADSSWKGVQDEKDIDEITELAKKSYRNEIEKQLESSGNLTTQEMERIHRKSIDKVLNILQTQLDTQLTLSVKAHLISTLESQFEKYGNLENLKTPRHMGIGIDLGTTYSCVGIYKDGRVHIIQNEIGQPTTPSYIAFDDGDVLIGQAAKDLAFSNPQNTIFDAKRLIGRKFNDAVVQSDIQLWPFQVVQAKESNVPKIKVQSREYFPEQISAKLLRYLKEQAEIYLHCPVENAVITVPAYFADGQRQATKDAGTIAGLNVLRIINEPTAAAISYSYEHRMYSDKKTICVFDLGGGTFDVSLLTTEKGHVNIIAVGGDTHLGGEDFDNELVRYCLEEFQKLHGINLAHGQNSEDPHEKFGAGKRLRRLRNECERSKRLLSSSHKVTIELTAIYDDLDLTLPITRSLFESLNAQHFERCIGIVDQVLKDVGMDKSKVDEIVLVGGSSKIPDIQLRLANYFELKNTSSLKKSVNMDTAVASGACIAAYLASFETVGQSEEDEISSHEEDDEKWEEKDQKLQISFSDVTPLSLGVEIFKQDEMKFSIIIPKNSQIPCRKCSTYGTIKDAQREVSINIYEGENPLAADNNLLGQFVLTNLPENCRKGERIEVSMEVNKEGILQVTASCPRSKSQNQICIRDHKGRLSKNQIENFRKTELFFTLSAL